MRILSVGKEISHQALTIESATFANLQEILESYTYDYIIIHGGDGTIRRVLKQLHTLQNRPKFILNPTGSFNVVAKLHRAPDIHTVLDMLASGQTPKTQEHRFFTLNDEIFLFSAGNMGDLQHIFLSETLRFGWLKHGMLKYILAVIFLLPVHLVMTPFMLASRTRFFIFTPLHSIKKLGSFYGEVPKELIMDLENDYNMLELDGDIVTIHSRKLHISQAGSIEIVTQ